MTAFGPDGFYSAKLRITRAKEHLNDLETRINAFSAEKPYVRISKPDPNGTHEIYKIQLTKPFPFRWRVLATEIIEHARSSLDHATWASAYLHTQNPNLEFGVFPFSSDAAKLSERIKGVSKDCPPEIQTLLGTFKPYKGGNDILYILNDMCNLSKHALVAFIAGAFLRGEIKGTGATGPLEFFDPLILDPTENEIPYLRVLTGSFSQHEIDFAIFPSIQYREATSEEPATMVLATMITEAERIVTEIEAKCREIGLQ